MPEEALRLGDLIDDYCPRCKLLLNHAVASLMAGRAVKVICKTCYTEHAYRYGKGGKKKAPAGMTLFDQVLASASPATSSSDEEDGAGAGARKKRAAVPARYIPRRKERPRKK